MPTVEKANTQISEKPKREPATAANTSSLMSTKPPTAVMMPSVISISPPIRPFHFEKLLREVRQRVHIVAVDRADGLLRQLFGLRLLRAFGFALQLLARFLFHLARIGVGDALLALQADDFRRFRAQRANGANVRKLIRGRRAATEHHQDRENARLHQKNSPI